MKRLIHIKSLIILIMEIIYLVIAFSISCILFGAAIGWFIGGIIYKKMFSYEIKEREKLKWDYSIHEPYEYPY